MSTLFDPYDEDDLPAGYPVINSIARRVGVGGVLLAYAITTILLILATSIFFL